MVRYYNYNGTSLIVGYVLNFENPQGSNFPQPVLTIDVYGNLLGQTSDDRQAIESVLSPIDFIGPGFLARPLVGGARAMAGAVPRLSAAAARTSRNLAFTARLRASQLLESGMRGAGHFPELALRETPAAFVLRESGEAVIGSGAVTAGVAESASVSSLTTVQATGPSFAGISSAIRAEVPGTIGYTSTSAAALGANAGGLRTPSRPGFHTHSTAPSVRRAFNVSGYVAQSVHILPQAVYRALRDLGWVRPDGRPFSAGRALTTTDLSLAAHRAFDAGWVPQWNAAAASGRAIQVRDVYNWVSSAIHAVDDSLISPAIKGAMHDRLRTELFVDLGLNLDDVIVPGG
jgi:hypothetical protein